MELESIAKKEIINQFGQDLIGFKPKYMNWNTYYMTLFNYYKAGLRGEKHYWDEDVQNRDYLRHLYDKKIPKMWLEKHHLSTDQKGIDEAMRHGRLDVVRELEKSGLIPNFSAVKSSVKKGYPIFQYVVNHIQNQIFFGIDELDRDKILSVLILEAAKSGHLSFIGYVGDNDISEAIDMARDELETLKILLSYPVLHSIGIEGNNDKEVVRNYFNGLLGEDVFKFFNTKGLTTWIWNLDLDITQRMIDLVIRNGYLDIYKDLIDGGYKPTTRDANTAVGAREMKILEFLLSCGIAPEIAGIDNFFSSGLMTHDDIQELLDLLSEYRVEIYRYAALYAANFYLLKNDVDKLSFLIDMKGIFPMKTLIQKHISKLSQNMLEYLLKHNLLPDADFIAKNGDFRIFLFYIQNELFPTLVDGANAAAANGNLIALKGLSGFKVYPNKTGIDDAVRNQKVNVIDWLKEIGLYGSKFTVTRKNK